MIAESLQPLAVPIEALSPHPRNYRSHPEDQILHLAESLKRHGCYRNVVCAREGTILAGHGVVAAARSIGIQELPVIRLDLAPDDPAALQVLALDNTVSMFAETDDRALSELLKSLRDSDMLLGTGFDDMKLAAMLMVTRPASEIVDHDHASEWVGMPEFENEDKRWKLILQCETEEQRDDLMKRLDLVVARRDGRTVGAWWPRRERDDLSSVRYAEGE